MSAPYRRSGRSLVPQIGPFCAAHSDGRASLAAMQNSGSVRFTEAEH